MENNVELLKRFEPVLRFTRGEKFYPIDAEAYVRESSLWVQKPEKPPRCIVTEKDLTLENLGNCPPEGQKSIYYLQFIEPLNLSELAVYLVNKTLKKKDRKEVFHGGRGRLSRVGYTSRFLDGLFSLSLLARGRLPGDRALAAALTYEKMRVNTPGHRYYGRVIRQSGWIILQYWFFYVYDDWRSGYYGGNDHEADWEMINLYLYEDHDGILHPEWAAYASHDFSGDDFRRRWDDPELQKIGDHPIVYVGVGSHASYFTNGDYLTEIELPFLSPMVRLMERLGKAWRRFLHRTVGDEEEIREPSSLNVFNVPFVDYARGDGYSIGKGAQKDWEDPIVLNPVPDWVENYRGLWGFYARDPFSGENAPSGMKYTRQGEVRRVWYDPVGWAGLDKVIPPNNQLSVLSQRKNNLDAENNTLRLQIAEKQTELSVLDIESKAMRELPYLETAYNQHQTRINNLSGELQDLFKALTQNQTMIGVLSDYERRLQQGIKQPVRDHLKRPLLPEKESELRLGWLAEIWSAISIGLMLITTIVLALFARDYLYIGLTGILILIVFLEAGFRRKLSSLINTLAVILAVICSVILIYEYFWLIVIVIVAMASLYVLWQNLREIWS